MRSLLAVVMFAVACGTGKPEAAAGQSLRDSTASVWLARADSFPAISDWLLLRAARATPDSTARAAIFTRIRGPLARARIAVAEAEARERSGDVAGAIRAYSGLHAGFDVLRMRSLALSGVADTAALRTELIRFADSSGAGDARKALLLLDRFPAAPPIEQLRIARIAARVGSSLRARRAYDAAPADSLRGTDLFAYATAISHTGTAAAAAEAYARVTSPAPLSSAARYQRGRLLVASGNDADGRAALREVATSARDSSGAIALVLLADLASDAGDDSASRANLLEIAKRFPATRFAVPARFDAALIALADGNPAVAATELAAIPDSLQSARYWLGRALEARGDHAGARNAWNAAISRDSTSYYAVLARARLSRSPLAFTSESSAPRIAAVDSAASRMTLLRRFTMTPEIDAEAAALVAQASHVGRDTLLAIGSALIRSGEASRAVTVGRRGLAAGTTASLLRLTYPVSPRDTIATEATRAGIDPALVAAIIRQESAFDPEATSAAGARGLMQIMPEIGRSIAPSIGVATWDPALLYDPGVNVEIGVRHLAPLLSSQPNLPRAIAAYNAGGSRVTRWMKKRGSDDPEMFTERISFAETRDYVKNVLRNRDMYHALYAW